MRPLLPLLLLAACGGHDERACVASGATGDVTILAPRATFSVFVYDADGEQVGTSGPYDGTAMTTVTAAQVPSCGMVEVRQGDSRFVWTGVQPGNTVGLPWPQVARTTVQVDVVLPALDDPDGFSVDLACAGGALAAAGAAMPVATIACPADATSITGLLHPAPLGVHAPFAYAAATVPIAATGATTIAFDPPQLTDRTITVTPSPDATAESIEASLGTDALLDFADVNGATSAIPDGAGFVRYAEAGAGRPAIIRGFGRAGAPLATQLDAAAELLPPLDVDGTDVDTHGADASFLFATLHDTMQVVAPPASGSLTYPGWRSDPSPALQGIGMFQIDGIATYADALRAPYLPNGLLVDVLQTPLETGVSYRFTLGAP